ncbi:hypothetical protein [Terricaulis silvestris]|uniref:Uncharacterized protein n=1 Tax=Terricaulis silvestris TaxID=2686094 RepID=A0A6I6MK55_9CAUL|nr:hypothetical protein [Terricaulis silvestris]QGZ93334.1 hypothetical protein DSM104635_00144 [Terricaulis silvestris]
MSQVKSYRMPSDRRRTVAVLEPMLRELLAGVQNQENKCTSVGKCHVEFWRGKLGMHCAITLEYRRVFEALIEPEFKGRYCDGRVEVRRWTRGPWEADFGVKVEGFDPLTNDVLPEELLKALRSGLRSYAIIADGLIEDMFAHTWVAPISRGNLIDRLALGLQRIGVEVDEDLADIGVLPLL